MNRAESCTITGDVYEYETLDEAVFKSDYGVFSYDMESARVTGKIEPFVAGKITGEDGRLVEEELSISAYFFAEQLFIPVEEMDGDYILDESYVISGELFVTLGYAKFLSPELLGGEKVNDQIVEVYRSALPGPRSIRDTDVEPRYVLMDNVVEVFNNARVERVIVV